MKLLIYTIFLAIFLSCTSEENNQKTAVAILSRDFELSIEHSSIEAISFFEHKIIKKANWGYSPPLIICDDVRISRSRIDKVLNFWENLGYIFGEITYSICPFDEQYLGAIYIMGPQSGFDFNMLSNTHTAYATFQDGSKRIVGAWIEIPDNIVVMERVLEHEVGHALGFQHSTQKYHMMHKDQRFGGFASSGLNSNLY